MDVRQVVVEPVGVVLGDDEEFLELQSHRAQRDVRFDRPFLFVVRDGRTQWPVFLAAVTDPSA